MEHTEVIVVGAGAAGLMAAYTLAKAGKSVTVLEGRSRTGGRIHTLDHISFFTQAELGAEFVHGDLPLTLALLREAQLETEEAGGEMWQFKHGRLSRSDMEEEGWDEMMEKLSSLDEDMTLNHFFELYFAGSEYEKLRASAKRYLAGYDSGDPAKASVLALRKEWQSEDEGAQHRIKNGYCALLQYLTSQCRNAGAQIYLNEPVKKITWQEGAVMITTAAAEEYNAQRVIVAVPLGILQQPESAYAAIHFEPPVNEQTAALQQMGYGEVIKILLRFSDIFWEDSQTEAMAGGSTSYMSFLFSTEVIPTWWTQAPLHVPLLTGWLAGPPAGQMKHLPDEELLEMALTSLSNIFSRDIEELKGKLIASHVANWSADPFTCGSYAYDTVASTASKELLNKGVAQTIFFAGEYLYDGPAMGTVEAALTSGQQVAAHILQLA